MYTATLFGEKAWPTKAKSAEIPILMTIKLISKVSRAGNFIRTICIAEATTQITARII